MPCRIGIDTGGTHTDLVLLNEDTQDFFTLKVPTTPEDHSVGVIDGIGKILQLAGLAPAAVGRMAYGTTIVTNLLIQRNGDTRIALIATEGFRDVIEIQRGSRFENVFDVAWKAPAPLVPRHQRFGVSERIDPRGDVVTALDEAAIRDICEKLRGMSIEGIVVSFINSYVNPAHEQRAAEIILEMLPGVEVTLSSDVSRQFREYERTSTATINAYVRKPLSEHLRRLTDRLQQMGVNVSPYIMRASGGMMTFDAASTLPVAITHSGPTAGIMAGIAITQATGVKDVITFDMGGTSSDVSLLRDGKPLLTNKGNIEGWPVILPMLDLVTVGAGGGTIAWLDQTSALKVGPISAGAVPGPACYGTGGEIPTITDCNLVLGRLNSSHLLGGARRLRPDLSEQALVEKIGKPLGMTSVEAARGIIEIVESHMVNAVKQISVRRGLDPRDFHLVGFGGAGPLHVLGLAQKLDITRVLVPPAPGNFSAMGQLTGDIRHDIALTRVSEFDTGNMVDINAEIERMVRDADSRLAADDVTPEMRSFVASVDLCYWGQNHEIALPVATTLTAELIAEVRAAFHAEHERNFGFAHPDAGVKCVNIKVSGIGSMPAFRMKKYPAATGEAVPQSRRQVVLPDGTSQELPVFAFGTLGEGSRITEPAIVEYEGSTLFIPPGWVVTFDQHMIGHAERIG